MPGDTTTVANKSLSWNAAGGLFKAEGVPIMPEDDAGSANRYPLMRLVATEKATGKDVAYLDVVLPVSEETTCSDCHDLGGSRHTARAADHLVEGIGQGNPHARERPAAARHQHPASPSPHRRTSWRQSPSFARGATTPRRWTSPAQARRETRWARPRCRPPCMHITATRCRVTRTTGSAWAGRPTADTQACYTCHPGRNTKCLRGAMTETVNCQNCHGDMKAVGGMSALKAGGSIDGANDGKPRRPWMDLPRCQSCHTGDAVNYLKLDPSLMASDGLRTIVAFDPADAAASPRLASNKRFAENSNSLFRFSKGHGGIACEGCHNSTHAIWSNPVDAHNDNVAAKELQGHTGTVAECSTCHAPGSLALTLNGPHGMHNVGDSRWTSGHESLARSNVQACAACHGTNYRGTVLSKTGGIPHLEHRVRHAHRGQGPGRGLLRLPQRPESVSNGNDMTPGDASRRAFRSTARTSRLQGSGIRQPPCCQRPYCMLALLP